MAKDLETRQAGTDGDMQCLDVSSITLEHTKQNNGHAEKQKSNGTSPNDSTNPLLSFLEEKMKIYIHTKAYLRVLLSFLFLFFFVLFFEGVSNNTSNGK